jgi:predicted DNA-binding protein with PD1-like motif
MPAAKGIIMRWIEDHSRLLVRFEVGEKLPESLVDLARRLGIASGSLSGIGGVRNVVLAYFDLQAREYVTFDVPGIVELVSLTGNVSLVNGQPFWHLHASVADREGNVKAGHLVTLEVAITAECWIERASKMQQRKRDDYSGLNLLDL